MHGYLATDSREPQQGPARARTTMFGELVVASGCAPRHPPGWWRVTLVRVPNQSPTRERQPSAVGPAMVGQPLGGAWSVDGRSPRESQLDMPGGGRAPYLLESTEPSQQLRNHSKTPSLREKERGQGRNRVHPTCAVGCMVEVHGALRSKSALGEPSLLGVSQRLQKSSVLPIPRTFR